FFFSSRRRHTRCLSDWSSDVCSSDLRQPQARLAGGAARLNQHRQRLLELAADGGEVAHQLVRLLAYHAALLEVGQHAAEQIKHRSEERRVGKECRSEMSADQ